MYILKEMGEQQCIPTMEHCTAIKTDELQMYAVTWTAGTILKKKTQHVSMYTKFLT